MRTASNDELEDAKTALVHRHGQAMMRGILHGFAGATPRSAMQNLIELMSVLVARFPSESKAWMMDILYSVSWVAWLGLA